MNQRSQNLNSPFLYIWKGSEFPSFATQLRIFLQLVLDWSSVNPIPRDLVNTNDSLTWRLFVLTWLYQYLNRLGRLSFQSKLFLDQISQIGNHYFFTFSRSFESKVEWVFSNFPLPKRHIIKILKRKNQFFHFMCILKTISWITEKVTVTNCKMLSTLIRCPKLSNIVFAFILISSETRSLNATWKIE